VQLRTFIAAEVRVRLLIAANADTVLPSLLLLLLLLLHTPATD